MTVRCDKVSIQSYSVMIFLLVYAFKLSLDDTDIFGVSSIRTPILLQRGI